MRASFRILAARDPQAVNRLLNFFTQRDLIPERIEAVADDDWLRVRIVISGLAAAHAQLIAEKMRQAVLVEQVDLRIARAGRALSAQVTPIAPGG